MPHVLVEGKQVFYTCPHDVSKGEGRGKVVILVHGARGNHKIWAPQLEVLAEFHTPFSFDLPGHGESEGSAPPDVATSREFLKALVDAVGLERFVIAGHSMGGSIGLDYALNYPGVEALILLGSGASWDIPEDFLDLFRNDPEEAMRRGMEVNFAKATSLAIRELHERNNATTAHGTTIADFEACNAFDVLADLHRIDVPVCIACGDEDAYADGTHVLIERMPAAEVQWIEAAGHEPSLEQPEATNRLFLDFLDSLD